VFPVSSLRQTINTKKETDFTSETLSSCCTNTGAPPYDQVCIIIHPYQHRCMSGLLSSCRLDCIISFRDPNFLEHVNLEWTYSQVPSRVYCSSGVGLRLLVRLEKSWITKSPHRYVWSETRHVSVWTWWGGPREDSSKPRCFWRIFTLWQMWRKPTPTPCPGFWYLTHRDMFFTQKKSGTNPVRISRSNCAIFLGLFMSMEAKKFGYKSNRKRKNWRLSSVLRLEIKVGLGISRTNADSQWIPVHNVFHRKFCCETIRR